MTRERPAMTITFHISELETAINRCRAAMAAPAVLQTQFNALATLYGSMIYYQQSSLIMAELDASTRAALAAWMTRPAPVVAPDAPLPGPDRGPIALANDTGSTSAPSSPSSPSYAGCPNAAQTE